MMKKFEWQRLVESYQAQLTEAKAAGDKPAAEELREMLAWAETEYHASH